MWEEASPESPSGRGRERAPYRPGESVHLIDAKKTALVERLRLAPRGRGKGVACLLPHSGVKVARTFRDHQQGPREPKKYRLNTKQVRSTKGLGVFPQAQPSPFSFSTGSTECEPCPGAPSLYPGLLAKRKSSSSQLPAANPRSLLRETEELRILDSGDLASHASILSPFRNPNI